MLRLHHQPLEENKIIRRWVWEMSDSLSNIDIELEYLELWYSDLV